MSCSRRLVSGAVEDSPVCEPEDLKGSASSFLALKAGSLIAWGRGDKTPQDEAQSPDFPAIGGLLS